MTERDPFPSYVVISANSDMTKFTDNELLWAFGEANDRITEAETLRDAVWREMQASEAGQ